jgi:hypothetical protein
VTSTRLSTNLDRGSESNGRSPPLSAFIKST